MHLCLDFNTQNKRALETRRFRSLQMKGLAERVVVTIQIASIDQLCSKTSSPSLRKFNSIKKSKQLAYAVYFQTMLYNSPTESHFEECIRGSFSKNKQTRYSKRSCWGSTACVGECLPAWIWRCWSFFAAFDQSNSVLVAICWSRKTAFQPWKKAPSRYQKSGPALVDGFGSH